MKRVLAIILLSLLLVSCNTETNEEPKVHRLYEEEYVDFHRENVDDYNDIYHKPLFVDGKLLEEAYDDILKTNEYKVLTMDYEVSEYDYGSFENKYSVKTIYKPEDNLLDSKVCDIHAGNKTIETIIRGKNIYQRLEETGIIDETPFYVDKYHKDFFYLLGLDMDFDKNFTRMMYFLKDSEVKKSENNSHTEYIMKVEDLEEFKTYLESDVADDFINWASNKNLDNLEGVDVIYTISEGESKLTLDLYLSNGKYSLSKSCKSSEDVIFRNMENIEAESTNLKVSR